MLPAKMHHASAGRRCHTGLYACLMLDMARIVLKCQSESGRRHEACLQGEYCLSYGAVGTRVALIASEPITGQAGDWVAVPHNTALVVISEKVSSNAGACTLTGQHKIMDCMDLWVDLGHGLLAAYL